MCLNWVSDGTVDAKIESDTPSRARCAESSSSTLQLNGVEKIHAKVMGNETIG
jgi:hypothetical protein